MIRCFTWGIYRCIQLKSTYPYNLVFYDFQKSYRKRIFLDNSSVLKLILLITSVISHSSTITEKGINWIRITYSMIASSSVFIIYSIFMMSDRLTSAVWISERTNQARLRYTRPIVHIYIYPRTYIYISSCIFPAANVTFGNSSSFLCKMTIYKLNYF